MAQNACIDFIFWKDFLYLEYLADPMKVWTDPNEFKSCSNSNVAFEKDIQVILLLGLLSASTVVIQRQIYDTLGFWTWEITKTTNTTVFTIVSRPWRRNYFKRSFIR